MKIKCVCGKEIKENFKNTKGIIYKCDFCGTEIFIKNEQTRKNNKKK